MTTLSDIYSVKQFFRVIVPALLILVGLNWATGASAQIVNFKPLERGEYTEEEEKLTILRGLEVSLEYAASLDRAKHDDIPSDEQKTDFRQDFRLGLRSVFHRDVEFQLVLSPAVRSFEGGELRERDEDEQNGIAETQPLSLNVREAYLRYKFNPRSGLIVGKQELSIGDRRGKVFNGIAPAITYDCRVGTWCMPFGAIKIGKLASDWIFHWALEYTAWDDKNDGYNNDTFQVEIFRIIYTENNVPLGKNNGPAFFNPDALDAGPLVDPSQATDSVGTPIFYDASSQDYFGFRVSWESGIFFMNFDLTSNQGDRKLHRFSSTTSSGAPAGLNFGGTEELVFRVSVSGIAWESEVGFRQRHWRLGVRLLNVDGDDELDPTDKSSFLGGVSGYHAITPGSYRGTRAFFNGSDNGVEFGRGLGRSVSNIEMIGFFFEFSDPLGKGMDYSLGIYDLELNRPVLDANGNRQSNVGVEINNVLSFYVHKAIKWQFEINIIDTQGAFAVDDFTRPTGRKTDFFTQGAVRLIYSF